MQLVVVCSGETSVLCAINRHVNFSSQFTCVLQFCFHCLYVAPQPNALEINYIWFLVSPIA